MDRFQRVLERFEDAGTQVVGVSCDSTFVQSVFAEQRGFTFPLLSDANREAGRGFDVLIDDFVGFKDIADRAVFVVDDDLKVRFAWLGGGPGLPEAEEALAAAESL